MSWSSLVGDRFLRSLEVSLDDSSEVRLLIGSEAEGDVIDVEICLSGVCAFHFETGQSPTVLMDIGEISLERFVESWRPMLQAGRRRNWPIAFPHLDELARLLRERGLRAYEVDATVGTSGWVLAGAAQLTHVSTAGPIGTLPTTATKS